MAPNGVTGPSKGIPNRFSHGDSPSQSFGERLLPFVLQFYGRPSPHLWEDEEGVVHEIPQGEGGEQGDPLMPALFALGQHQAPEAIQESLQPSQTLMAFLDDVYVTTPPERTATVEQSVEVNLWTHARIQANQGKTQVWKRCRERPPDCDDLFSELTGHPTTCGVETHHCPPINRASLSSALLSVVRILLRLSWLRRPRSTESCWRGSQRCPISNVRGSCCCSVQHREPVTFSELSIPNTISSSPSAMMLGSGSALEIWCTPQSHSQCGKWPVCHLELVA